LFISKLEQALQDQRYYQDAQEQEGNIADKVENNMVQVSENQIVNKIKKDG
jgi:hypothetical protein